MKRFSVRLFALGLALGAVGAATVLAASAYARTSHANPIPAGHARVAQESGQPVLDWNNVLLSLVNTPGAQPANIQPTRNFAILHAAIYDAVDAIDRTHEPYLIDVRAPGMHRRQRPPTRRHERPWSASTPHSRAPSTAITRLSSVR